MAKDSIVKLHKHFNFLSLGDFSEEAFRREFGNEGFTSMGRMTPERRKLIISDAKRNKEELERKFPWLVSESKEVVVETPSETVQVKPQIKSKGAK